MLFVNAKDRLALTELRSTTGGLQTVLLKAESRKPLRHKGLRDWENNLTSNLTEKEGGATLFLRRDCVAVDPINDPLDAQP